MEFFYPTFLFFPFSPRALEQLHKDWKEKRAKEQRKLLSKNKWGFQTSFMLLFIQFSMFLSSLNADVVAFSAWYS